MELFSNRRMGSLPAHAESELFLSEVQATDSKTRLNLENLLSSSMTTSNAAYNMEIVLQNLSALDPVTSLWENLNDTTNLAMKYI